MLASCLIAASARAQGLGDVAARERSKRVQPKKVEAKVYTDDDLSKGRPPGAKTEDGATAPAPEVGGDPGSPSPTEAAEARRQVERGYLSAIGAAQAQVAGAEARIRQLSDRLNPMSLSYIYGAGGSNDANEELRVREELRQAESELTAARQAVVAANQNLQDYRQGRPTSSDEPR